MFENGGRVYKALVKSSNSTTGEINVSIPQVFGASNEVGISFIGRSAVNGVWRVPTPGSVIVVATDDDQFSNVFWMEQNNATSSDISSSINNLGVYTNFTPTYTGFFSSAGNATITGRYTQIGKMVMAYYYIKVGTTSTFNFDPLVFNLPVAPVSSQYQSGISGLVIDDSTGDKYPITANIETDGKLYPQAIIAGSYIAQIVNVDFAYPITFYRYDIITVSTIYEAA